MKNRAGRLSRIERWRAGIRRQEEMTTRLARQRLDRRTSLLAQSSQSRTAAHHEIEALIASVSTGAGIRHLNHLWDASREIESFRAREVEEAAGVLGTCQQRLARARQDERAVEILREHQQEIEEHHRLQTEQKVIDDVVAGRR